MAKPDHLHFFIDPSRCIGCQACVQACTECDTHRGESMIHLEYVDRAEQRADRAGRVHALRAADLRRGLPGRRDQAHRRRRRAVGAQAALHRLRQLRRRLPVRRARGLRRPQDHDEVRHVLRPHQRRQEADVRDGLPEPGAVLRHRARRSSSCARMSVPINQFQFGEQTITTRVYMMAPRGLVTPGAVPRRDRGHGRPRADRRPVSLRWSRGSGSVCRGGDLMATPGQTRSARRLTLAPDGRPAARAAGVAAGFPDRLAAGSVRRAPRLREVPGPDQRGVHGRPVLDRRPELAAQRARACRRSRRIAAGRGRRRRDRWCSTIRGEHDTCVLVRLSERELVRLQPEVHAPVVRGDSETAKGVLHCPCHEGFFDLRTGRRSPGRRPGRCRGLRSRCAATMSTPPASK